MKTTRPNVELITAIKLSGRTQAWLAERTGISESYISGFVTGRRVPDAAQRAKICRALRVHESQVFSEAA